MSTRRASLALLVVLLAQFALGITANLYTTVPDHHPGAHPHNYLTGSVASIGWAIGHSGIALAAHALLGIVLVLLSLTAAAAVLRRRRGATLTTLMSVGALSSIGAGFNGASFLDFNNDVSSLIMALLWALATLSYIIALYVSPAD